MRRLRQWCEDVNQAQGESTFDFVYVDQESFERYKPKNFSDLLEAFREYKSDPPGDNDHISDHDIVRVVKDLRADL
jgi:hypothetical protein